MTLYGQNLLSEAIDMWTRGYLIPLDMFAKLAQEGFDVPALEAQYYQPDFYEEEEQD